MAGERIIPLTGKDKRKLRKRLWQQIWRTGIQLGIAGLLALALLFFKNHFYNRFFFGASVVLYAGFLVFGFFRDRAAGGMVPLLRDWYVGKKRVVSGRVEKVEYREPDDGPAEQIYDIGAYRFALRQLSPVLKQFRQVMPGQAVQVHQCLHSGLVLKVEVLPE